VKSSGLTMVDRAKYGSGKTSKKMLKRLIELGAKAS
jgi:hypothetical protein